MANAWLLIVLTVSFALLEGVIVEGKKPYRPEVLTPFEIAALGDIPTCCPENPLQYCDFYFDGHLHKLPTFHLKDDVSGDHPLSIVDRKDLKWKGWMSHFSPCAKDSKSGSLAYVSSTFRNGTFLQCDPLPPSVTTGDQFFVAPVGDGRTDGNCAKLQARTFQRGTKHQHGMKFFFNRCILLPLTNIQIPTAHGNLNLAIDDGNVDYPEHRRCLVFRTTR